MTINPKSPKDQFARVFWLGIGGCTILILSLWLLDSCTKSQGPGSNYGIATVVITGELIEAGCIENDDAALGNVQAALDFAARNPSDASPPWIFCLIEGGNPKTCGACSSQTNLRR